MKTATVEWAKTARLWVNEMSHEETHHKMGQDCSFVKLKMHGPPKKSLVVTPKKHPNGWTKFWTPKRYFPKRLRIDQRIARSKATHPINLITTFSHVLGHVFKKHHKS